MMCERVKLPHGSVAIVCGGSHSCAFCGGPADKLCDFKIEKATDIPHGRLRIGDVIETRQHKHHLPVRVVARFQDAIYKTTMYGLQFPDGRCWIYYLTGNDQARVLKPGTCDKPCCEKCSRQPGEDLDYCMDHWRVGEFQALDQRKAAGV